MYKRQRLATGCIAAGGTLGVLIPPSIVLIVYGLATGTSIGRLFLCGVIPGLLLAGLFMLWAYIYSYFIDKKSAEILRNRKPPTLKEKLEVIPRVLPFLLIVVGVLYVLYGGVATPSEASGVGAFLVFVMIAVVYKIYQPKKIWDIVKVSMKESVMIMFIIAGSYIFAFSLSTLYVTQSIAQTIVEMGLNKWVMVMMVICIIILCIFPEIVTWLPDKLMGKPIGF